MKKPNSPSSRKRWGFRRRLAYNCLLQTVPPLLHLLFDFQIEGTENVPAEGTGVILAPNHQSFLDGFLLASAIPFRLTHFFGSQNLMSKWYFSWVKYGGAYPSHQSHGRAQPVIDHFVDLVKDGSAVSIFPEGERSWSGSFQRAKAGCGRIAHQSHGIVIPVYIEGARNALARGKISPAFGTRILVKFGKPLDLTKEYSQPLTVELAREISKKVFIAIKELQKEVHQTRIG
ncbi:MAG: lysophospholipid acyltransferase family protein [Promethearchaeota archaeon]